MSELAKALVAARAEMRGTVFKGGTNQHQRYAYVGHEQVMTSGAREALGKHGLSLVQTGVEYVGEVPGGKTQCLLWRGSFALLHEAGEARELSFVATTMASDKAAFVASTALDRTAWLRVCALAGSSEEDPEDDVHDKRAQRDPKPENVPQREPDPAISRLLDQLYAVESPQHLALLRSEANKLREKMGGDERQAVKKAIEYAAAKVAQEQQEVAP